MRVRASTCDRSNMRRDPKMKDTADLRALVAQVEHELGDKLVEWPGGWPNQINLALLDAVFSIRARYGGAASGVRAVARRWGDAHVADDLRELAAYSGRESELVELLGNRQVLSGGLTKAVGAATAASRLVAAGVVRGRDLDMSSSAHKRAYLGVRGLGPVTWVYFGMLLGHTDVKADVHICAFVKRALGRSVDPEEARTLVTNLATLLEKDASTLDHAIWSFQKSR